MINRRAHKIHEKQRKGEEHAGQLTGQKENNEQRGKSKEENQWKNKGINEKITTNTQKKKKKKHWRKTNGKKKTKHRKTKEN